MSSEKERPIFIKRIVAGKGKGHHGGAWKLAYADFMTAMMAFFLLMWLLSSTSPVQRRGIAEYFQMPLKAAMVGGKTMGMDNSIIEGGGRDISSEEPGDARRTDGKTQLANRSSKTDDQLLKAARDEMERREQERLHDLQIKLMAAIDANPALRQFRQQIRIDSTQQGLRIEIVDTQKRPMFALSSNTVQPYMRDILREIGKTLNDVPNRIVVQGHTDAVQYAGGEKGYSNWELSADRANASRRELVAGGMDEAKVLRVLGLASTQNLNKKDPLDPENRRISVIVLNRKTEASMMRDDGGGAATLSNGQPSSAKPLLGQIVPAAPRQSAQ